MPLAFVIAVGIVDATLLIDAPAAQYNDAMGTHVLERVVILCACLCIAGCGGKNGNNGGGGGNGGNGGNGGGGGGGGGIHGLNVSVTGNGNVTSSPGGISCPMACSTNFTSGTQVTLTAQPQNGATFVGWGGACSGANPTCALTLSSDMQVSAQFSGGTSTSPQLTVMLSGAGSVSSVPAGINCASPTGGQVTGTCNMPFAAGTSITLTATAGTSAAFSGWSGGGCSGTGSCTLTLSADTTVTATFAHLNQLTVTLPDDGSGTVVSTPPGISCTSGSSNGCSFGFPNGVNVSLTATPAAGSTFAGWSFGGCNGSGFSATCPVAINSSGSSVAVYFSAWSAHLYFPASITGLAYDGTHYVAVGSGAAAVTSTDGQAWTGHVAPAPAANNVVLASSNFYAAADGATVLVSTDAGATWSTVATGATASGGGMADLHGLAYGKSTLVAVGTGGAIVYSTNLSTWTSASSGTVSDLDAVTFANGTFVAVGVGGTILSSGDGITWTARTSQTNSTLNAVTGAAASNFVAVGSAGAVVTSPDGATWTAQTTFTTSTLRAVATSGSLFAAAGDAQNGANSHPYVFTSTNGVAWTARDSALFNEPIAGVAFAGSNFYALGTSGSIARSSDGTATSWSPVLSPGGRGAPGMGQSTSLANVGYNGSLYVAIGNFGSIFTSPDGTTWTSRRATSCCIFNQSLAWGAGLASPVWVVSGWANPGWYILSSPDGVTWTQRASGAQSAIGALGYGGNTTGFSFVSSYNNGPSYTPIVETSADGITWTASTMASAINVAISSVAYGNGKFVAGGGGVYTSSDGASWVQQSLPSGSTGFGALAFGNGTFVALDNNNATATSTNGVTWTRHPLSVPNGTQFGSALVFGNGAFYSSGWSTSTDGATWSSPAPSPDLPIINGGVFNGAVFAGGHWLGVGASESILMHP